MITSRKARLIILAAILCLFAVCTAAADPVEGFWKSINEDGEVSAFWQITVRNGMAFGRILKISDQPDDYLAEEVQDSYPNHPERRALNTMRVLDVEWIYNMRPRRNSSGQWTGGFIIDPEDGKRYALDLNVLPGSHRKAIDGQETLEVKGKILMFSRSQYWVRSSMAEADNFVQTFE